MSFSRGKVGLAAALLAALCACGSAQRADAPGSDRVLITHTENLSGDAALDGAARAISYLVRSQLTGNKSLAVYEAAQPGEAVQRRAGRIVRSWLDANGGKLTLHVTVRSAGGKTVEQWESTAAVTGGPAALANAVAKHIAPSTTAPSPVPPEAASMFGAALSEQGAGAIPALRKVVAQAPAWGDAYYLLGANLLATGKREEALKVWEEGSARAADEISKARMGVGIATAMNQPGAVADATEKLAGLLTSEPEVAMQAGQLRLAQSDFVKAAALMKAAVEAERGVGEWWNQLAFAQAFAGGEKAALESIDRYIQVAPKSGNPPDSRGEIQFLSGRFKEAAASFTEAFRKEPAFLNGATVLKGAEALWMAGDATGANGAFERYMAGPMKNHPLSEVLRARWEFKTGKKDEAIRRAAALASAAATQPGVAAACWTQIAWWRLRMDDRAKALEAAKTALQKAQTPAAKRDAMLAFYLAQPSAPLEEWKRRANGNPPADVLALALMFDRKWKDAAPVLAELTAKTHPFRAGQWRVLYGWALIESGQPDKAKKWLRWYPIPLSSGGDLIEPWVMEKIAELRKRANL